MSWLFPSLRQTHLHHIYHPQPPSSPAKQHTPLHTLLPSGRGRETKSAADVLHTAAWTVGRCSGARAGVRPQVFCSLFFTLGGAPVPSSLPVAQQHPARRWSTDGGEYSSPTHHFCMLTSPISRARQERWVSHVFIYYLTTAFLPESLWRVLYRNPNNNTIDNTEHIRTNYLFPS